MASRFIQDEEYRYKLAYPYLTKQDMTFLMRLDFVSGRGTQLDRALQDLERDLGHAVAAVEKYSATYARNNFVGHCTPDYRRLYPFKTPKDINTIMRYDYERFRHLFPSTKKPELVIDALPESVTSLWTRPKKKQRFAAPDDSDMQSVKTSAVSYCDSSNEIPIPAKAEEQVPSIARIILAGVRTLATGSAEDDDQPAVAINQANTVGAAQQSLCSASFATEMLDLPISTSKDWLHPVETVNELGADISLLDLASLPANNDSVQEYPAPTPYVSKVPSIANSEYAPEKQMGFLQMLLDSLQPDQKTQTPLPRSVSFSLLDPDSESPLGMQMGLLTGSPPSKATEYEIQKVIGMRQASSGREYLVHWVGYTIDEATWVPWDGGWTHDMDLIRDFHDRANKCPDLSDVDMYIDQGAESADTRSLDGEMDTWRTEAFQIEDPVDVDVISAATQAYDVAGKIQSMGKSPSQLFDDFMEETLFSPDCDYFPPALNSV